MKHIEFELQTSDGLKLYAQEWHPVSDPSAVVCLVHGKGEHSGRYSNVVSALTKAGYILLAFDIRGHGKSDGRRGHSSSYETVMDDISILLNEASNRFPELSCFLYGHSMGGNLVINYVLRRKPQLAGVIVTGPWLQLSFKPSACQLLLGKIMYTIIPFLSMTGKKDNQALSRNSEVVLTFEKDPLSHDKISVRLALDVINSGKWALEHAAEFSLPLLIMHGSADRKTSPEASRDFSEHISGNCTYKLWEGLYHEIHNEPEQQEVFDFLIKWLKKHL